jgi:type I restriction enzyme S subunit
MENSFPWVPENTNWEIAKGKRFFANVKIPNVNIIESNVLSLTLRGVVRNNMDKPEGLMHCTTWAVLLLIHIRGI